MWTYLDLLPEISNIESNKPTFKYIHTLITHFPYAIDSDGNVVFDRFVGGNDKGAYSDVGAYYSAKEVLSKFSSFVSWLKANDIYDNTFIAVVADHGRGHANSLMMIKDFNSNNDFSESNVQMTNADTAEIINNAADLFEKGKFKINGSRTYSVKVGDQNINLDTIKYDTWEVTGSHFDKDNWKKIN